MHLIKHVAEFPQAILLFLLWTVSLLPLARCWKTDYIGKGEWQEYSKYTYMYMLAHKVYYVFIYNIINCIPTSRKSRKHWHIPCFEGVFFLKNDFITIYFCFQYQSCTLVSLKSHRHSNVNKTLLSWVCSSFWQSSSGWEESEVSEVLSLAFTNCFFLLQAVFRLRSSSLTFSF